MPQDLRALNLAAYEMVDYVIIDGHATPIENIRLLEPDMFAKGYEYVAAGMPGAPTSSAAPPSSPIATSAWSSGG